MTADIEVAEPPAPPNEAPRWSRRAGDWLLRVLALGIDSLLVLVAASGLGALARAVGLGIDLPTLSMAGALLLWGPYVAVWMAATNGQTIGKSVVGLRVIRDSGRRMTWAVSLVRDTIVRGALSGPMLAIPSYLWPLRDPWGKTWHDLISRTTVVRCADEPRRLRAAFVLVLALAAFLLINVVDARVSA